MGKDGKAIGRIAYMDAARALCMLYIVAYWHLSASIKDFIGYFPYAKYAVVVALATFTYLSGFFMAGKVRTPADIGPFFKKRLQRFYPLYLLACLSMFAGHLITGSPNLMNLRQLLLSCVGLSSVIGPAPTTLWYFSMIMFCYGVTPLLVLPKKTLWKVACAVGIFVLLALAWGFLEGDRRVLMYYPMYVLGLLSQKVFTERIAGSFGKLRYFVCAAAVLAVGVWTDERLGECLPVQWVIALAAVYSVLWFSKLITPTHTHTHTHGGAGRVFQWLSYLSMAAYLFHGQIYLLFEFAIGKFSVILAYLVVLPLTLGIAWVIQKIYDWICQTLFDRHVQCQME